MTRRALGPQRRTRAPPLGAFGQLRAYQQLARLTGVGDEYLHLCCGEVLPYQWRPTTAIARFRCARCGAVGRCVACAEERGEPLVGRVGQLAGPVVPVVCQRHGGLDAGEGVALAVGEPVLGLAAHTRHGDDEHGEHMEHIEQAALFG